MIQVTAAQVMLLSILTVFGVIGGVFFGRYQLMRWKLWEGKQKLYLIAGCVLIFGGAGYLNGQYGYHILKILRYWILLYGLLLLGMLDQQRKIIPNRALLALLGVRTLLFIPEGICFFQLAGELLISSFAGLFGGLVLFLAAGIIARSGIGMGDVKLIAVTGYFLGFKVLMSSLIITMVLTVLGGIITLVFKKAGLRSEMPFAPFVFWGTLTAVILGC